MQVFRYQSRGEDAQGKRLQPRWRWKILGLMGFAACGSLGWLVYWWLHVGQTLIHTWLNQLWIDFLVGGTVYGSVAIAMVILADLCGIGEIKNKTLRRIVTTFCTIGCIWFLTIVVMIVIYNIWFVR